jgi:hypothetical protein
LKWRTLLVGPSPAASAWQIGEEARIYNQHNNVILAARAAVMSAIEIANRPS